MPSTVNPAIFRDYDIRGTYPDQLNEDSFYLLGRAIATYLKVPEIAVGYDTRLSSPSLFEAMTRGIMEQGVNVVNLGNISTEIHYFASGKYQYPANIIISASHNPPQYNGVKMVIKGVIPLHGEYGFPEIKQLALSQAFPEVSQKGTMTEKNIMDEWITHARSFIDEKSLRPIRVVVDAGNGMGGISWQQLIGKLPIEIIPLYFEPDGNFPHHLPDPLDEDNLHDLKQAIKREKADLGLAIDGDADRLFVVDSTGRAVSGTLTTAMLAAHLLKKFGPAPVLYNVVTGQIVEKIIHEFGGTGRRVRVGHSFIKQYMKEDNALFAGEHSGHFYFRDNFFADSSLIAGLLLLEYVSARNQPFVEIVEEFDVYPQSGEINFVVGDVPKVIDSLEAHFASAEKIEYIDGVSIWYPEWWCNIRASKTEPLLRLNVEANNLEILTRQLKEIEDTIIKEGGSRKGKG